VLEGRGGRIRWRCVIAQRNARQTVAPAKLPARRRRRSWMPALTRRMKNPDLELALIHAVDELAAAGPAISWCSCQASGNTRGTRAFAQASSAGRPKILPLFAAPVGGRSGKGVQLPPAAPHRAGHQCGERHSAHPLPARFAMWWIRACAGEALTPSATRSKRSGG